MTPDQVRALPGTSWSGLETRSGRAIGTIHFMKGLSTTRVEGHDFKASVYFDEARKLQSITLTEAVAARPFAQCERGFHGLLRSFEGRYGSFSPHLKPGKQLGANIEWHALPGSSSKYFVLTSGTASIGEARRRFGPAWMSVKFDADDKGSCEFALTFQRD